MAFEQLIGNDKIKDILKESVKKGNILHSYLFVGNEGIGKFHFAKEFTKMILCFYKNGCNQCKSCKEFDTENHPDFLVVEPEGNTIKVEQIRQMISKIIEKPIISDKKVYIVNDSDKMTEEAQNTLLKTLEEPPENIIIILIAEKEEKILSTIKSRCTKITFQPIEQDKLKEILKKQYQYENISEHLLTFFNGSIKKALNVKEKKEVYEQIEKMVLGIKQMNKIEMLNQKNNIDKEEIINILEYMNLLFWEQSTQVDTKERESAVKSILIIEETKKRIQSNCNFDMTVDNMLMQLWEEWNEKNDRS